MKTLRIITTTLGATVMGIAIGVLFAPNKGSKTRQKLSRKSHEYADYLTDSFDDMIDFITDSVESVDNEIWNLTKKYSAKPTASRIETLIGCETEH